MKLVFCGTPEFAVPTLRALVESRFQVALVVTQPDKPKGRGLELTASPVRRAGEMMGIPVIQPEKIKQNDNFRAQLSAITPQAIVVVGYGKIIPPWMINLPPLGNINLHASLLPRYRGAAPIQWAIASGETVTGVTTMRIDAGLDTGDILLQKEVPIAPEDTAETLSPRLAPLGADLVVETLRGFEAGSIHPEPQDHSKATLAPLLTKEDGVIDFTRSASEICNRLRGFQPWPGAYTTLRGKQLRVHAAHVAEAARGFEPGQLAVKDDRLLVGAGKNTALELLELQLEGKKRSTGPDFVHGYRLRQGERLG
jgi:methionyl-tRNA formyltransferase